MIVIFDCFQIHQPMEFDNLTIENNKNEYEKFTVTNIEGKVITEKILPQFKNDVATIDLANLDAGIYFLTLYSPLKNKVFKLIR